jgi:hypothetical protein
MREINLYKIWEVMNKLSYEEGLLSDKDIFVSFLGCNYEYSSMSFEFFLEHYSFKFENDVVVVYNNDPIPWETVPHSDYSYVPIPILGFGEKELENYINQSVSMQLEQQEKDKEADRESIREQIKRLEKRLNN